MATEFQKASKGKIVSDTPAMQEFERIREEASIEAAAQRAGKSPEEIKAEAKAAGTDPISLIKDKYPTPEAQKKTANRAPAEPVADEIPKTPGKLESLKKEIQAGTYNPIKGIAEGLGVEEPKPKAAPKKAAKEKKKAEAAPTVQEAPKTVAEQVKSGAAINKEQAAIRGTITSAPQFAIITAESPRFDSASGGNEALKKELESKGYKFEQMEGMYGNKENPFLVETNKLSDIQSLGKKYGQESVILADNDTYKMQFTSGPKEGQYYTANTITQYTTPPDDYYSTVVREGKPVYWAIDFDMDNPQGKSVADTDRLKKAEDKRTRKTNVAKVNKSLDDYRQKGPPPATAKGILSGVVEDVAQETGISSSQLSKALDVIENKAKLSGESLEQVAKRIPDPRLRSALGLIAVGLAGFAIGRGTDKKKESGAASTGFNEAAKKRLEELRRKKAGK